MVLNEIVFKYYELILFRKVLLGLYDYSTVTFDGNLNTY